MDNIEKQKLIREVVEKFKNCLSGVEGYERGEVWLRFTDGDFSVDSDDIGLDDRKDINLSGDYFWDKITEHLIEKVVNNKNEKKMPWEDYPFLVLPKDICEKIQKLSNFVAWPRYSSPYNDFVLGNNYVTDRLKNGEIGYIDGIRIIEK